MRARWLKDLAWVAVGFMAVRWGWDALGWPRAGSFAVIAALAVAAWRLRAGGQGWADIGLRRPASLWKSAAWVVALYLLVGLGQVLLVAPLAQALGWAPLDIGKLGPIQGNLPWLLVMLAVAWTTAGFGEEVLFRGFVQQRLEALLAGRRGAVAVAVLLQALAFGVLHAYLGARGVATATWVGLVFGTACAVGGRNLWPMIVAHGLIDTLSLLAIYAGMRPGG